ncbi:MAG: hypothetical protein KJ626_15605 [Verrucomicrobia bacterium]|nr:hypothetical protein [Verrucomicrobiota bacterium]
MSAVSEWIAREYFESLGFLVQQPVKYQVAARAKRLDEEVDLVILNPEVKEQRISKAVIWGSSQLQHIARAVIGVRGWHTDRFSPAVLKQSPEIFKFAEDKVVEKMSAHLGEGRVARILCVPDLPSSASLKKDALELFKSMGIDGVIPFRTMLLELAASIDTKKNYEKSDLLQIIRIFKNYGLLRDAQMELFGKKRRKSSAD